MHTGRCWTCAACFLLYSVCSSLLKSLGNFHAELNVIDEMMSSLQHDNSKLNAGQQK